MDPEKDGRSATSESDSADSLMDDTTHLMSETKISRRAWSLKKSPFAAAFLGTFTALMLGSAIHIALFTRLQTSLSNPGLAPLTYLPAALRDFNTERFFLPNGSFDPQYPPQVESERAWQTLHERWVSIEDPKQYNLDPSEPDVDLPSNEKYSIAAWHQLHCLRIIRYTVYHVLQNSSISFVDRPTNVGVTWEEAHPHVKHCFDYLRQSVMCCADPTLEPFTKKDGKTPDRSGSSGYGATHQCRDFDGLKDWIFPRTANRPWVSDPNSVRRPPSEKLKELQKSVPF